MGSQRICPLCGKPIEETDESVPYKNRVAHRKCFLNLASVAQKNRKADSKDREAERKAKAKVQQEEKAKESRVVLEVSEEEYKEKKAVLEYLEQLSGQPATAKVYQLLKNYATKYRLSYQGMLETLQYYYEVLDNPPKGDCIGIIPYYYDDACKYMKKFQSYQHVNDDVTAHDLKEMYKETVITIKHREPEGLIDLSSLK
jgi:hypothetical protein